MCRRPRFTLTARQRRALIQVRDHHPAPHLREKAAALLKVADGWDIRDVAAFGLLKPRSRTTVAAWLNRYQARGLAGLGVAKGRGRKPAFSPRRAVPPPGPGRGR
jgi:Winged helix-turn helix